MNCIIIEDQQPAQEILQLYISDLEALHLVGTYTDALQAIDTINSGQVDLIFLDIHLPKLSGIDFLKTLSQAPQVILTTAFSDYALESYELGVVDYLLKPFSFQRFVKAVAKATAGRSLSLTTPSTDQPQQPQEIFLKSGYEHIKVAIGDIYYLKSDSDYTEFYLPGEKHLSSEPLKYWEEQLKGFDFVRIHKSHVINVAKIQKISGSQVYLSSGAVLPIGRAYKEGFTQRFLK